MPGLTVYVVVLVTEGGDTPIAINEDFDRASNKTRDFRALHEQGLLHPSVKAVEARVLDIAEALKLSQQVAEREIA